uniref:MADF domain-containing protein n=1 Tax=Steinernema glaseri TaxID=37863 RepID=A0A1I7ZBK9_9BILA
MYKKGEIPEVSQEQEIVMIHNQLIGEIAQVVDGQSDIPLSQIKPEEPDYWDISAAKDIKVDRKGCQRIAFKSDEIRMLWEIVISEMKREDMSCHNPRKGGFWTAIKERHKHLRRRSHTYARKFQLLINRRDYSMLSPVDQDFLEDRMKRSESAPQFDSSTSRNESAEIAALAMGLGEVTRITGETIEVPQVIPPFLLDIFSSDMFASAMHSAE